MKKVWTLRESCGDWLRYELMAKQDLYANHIGPKVRMTHVVTRLKLNKELYDEIKKMSKSGDPTIRWVLILKVYDKHKNSLVNRNAAPIHFDQYGTNCLFYIDDEKIFQLFYDRFPKLFAWTRYNGETPYGHFIYRNKLYNFRSIDRKRLQTHIICDK